MKGKQSTGRLVKQVICALLVMVSLLTPVTSALPGAGVWGAGVEAEAASTLWNAINRSNIVTYPVKASGKIYGYTDSSLKNKSGWIDCKNDECRIIDINSSGTAYKVRYPLSGGGTAVRWFHSTDFTCYSCELASRPDRTFVSYAKVYKHASGNASYGYAMSANNQDPIYRLGIDLSTWRQQILYRTNNGTWKMGWANYNDVN